jgi:Zn-dependent protease
MLLNLLQSGLSAGFDSMDFKLSLVYILLSLPIIMFALSAHETAHGLVANWMGDPTAKNLGRLTLNPFKHLNPIGFLSMLIVGFGWANPVPINTRNFKNPRVGMAISGIAGPISNFLIASVSLSLFLTGSISMTGTSITSAPFLRSIDASPDESSLGLVTTALTPFRGRLLRQPNRSASPATLPITITAGAAAWLISAVSAR